MIYIVSLSEIYKKILNRKGLHEKSSKLLDYIVDKIDVRLEADENGKEKRVRVEIEVGF